MKPLQTLRFGSVRSFRSRLMLLAALTGALAAGLVCAALVTAHQINIRAMVTEHLQSQGEVISFNVAATLIFDRPDEAVEALSSLQVVDHLVAAHLFDAEGWLFAARTLVDGHAPPGVAPMPPGLYREGGWLIHHAPVMHNEEQVGTLVLVYDTRWVTSRMWNQVATALLITALAMFAAVLVAQRLQRALAQPVQEIIRTSRRVAESGDFSLAARRFEDDELGELTNAFNTMLARIDQKSVEAKHAHEQFRIAVEASPNGMVMVDEQGRILLVNQTMERLFGYPRDELIGQPVDMLVPDRFQDKHAGYRHEFYRNPQSRPMGADRGLWAVHKDGSEFPVEIGLNPIPTEHGLRVLSSIVDITERKHAETELRDREERLTTLTNAVPAFVWSADPQGRTLSLNDQWYEYTGIGRDVPLDPTAEKVIYPADRARAAELWQQAAATGTPYEAELRIRRHDGEYRWFLTRAMPLRNDAAQVVGWFGTSTDIEDRKRAEMERDELLASERAARSEAERADRMKDEFVATLSHELRTPLTAILGWAHMLQAQSGDDPVIGEGLATIERNARVQTQIIEDLLDMSRIVTGKIRLDVQLVELPEVIDAAIDTIRPAAEAKGLQLQKIIDPNVGPVHGDTNRLQQIVWNLLSNAVKFTPKGGRVQVALQRVNSHIEINVADTGEGITPEFVPHLFERFRQADASSSRAHTGLGIGLALVKHLTELHGGSVLAHSPGKDHGATFTIMLPLAIMHRVPGPSEPPRRHPTRAPAPAASRVRGPDLGGVRVLVVEDENDARLFIERLLLSAGAKVHSAASAAEALEKLRDFRPDVIISDIGMPYMDGYQFIRELRRRPAAAGGRIPAVALTAFARSEDRTRALMAGYQMHVAKPVEAAELLATVAALTSLKTRNELQALESDE
jgi:PAS domain S-box-containing protein